MSYFGVPTWEEVLEFFGEGRELEGRWGWLETLRQAELGDEISFYDDVQATWPPSESPVYRGRLVDREGKLFLQSGTDLMGASEAAWAGDVYYLARSFGRAPAVPYSGPLYANQMYMHLRFGAVDKLGAALDGVGIATFFVPHPAADAVGFVADVWSLGLSGRSLGSALWTGEGDLVDLGIDVALDLGSLVTLRFGVVFDVASLGKNVVRTYTGVPEKGH